MRNEIGEQRKLLTRELHAFSGAPHLSAAQIDDYVPELTLRAGRHLSPSASEYRPDSGYEFSNGEGLGHVVIGTEFQSDYLVDLLPSRGQHDDRQRWAVGTNRLADLEAAEAGHHDVQNHKIGVSRV